MVKMTSRERVLATLAHKEPDRMPVDMMGTASCMEDTAYLTLRDYLGLKGKGRIFRRYWNVSYYDDRILELLNVDFRRVWMRPSFQREDEMLDGEIEVNEWGMHIKRRENAVWFVNEPLSDASISDLEKYPWPDPTTPGRTVGLAKEAETLHRGTSYAISARQPTHGLFELAQRLRGPERFLMDTVVDKPFAIALIQKLLEVRMAFFEVYLREVGAYVDMVETADDYGTQNSLMISPETFKEIFLPARKELNEHIKRLAPRAKVFMHSDGAIRKLIPLFIESGVNVLNPVEPDVPGNDPKELKEEFGSELVFHGNLDTKGSMRGSLTDVQTEVQRIKEGIAEGGGYIFAPTNHFQSDIPPENIVEAYHCAVIS